MNRWFTNVVYGYMSRSKFTENSAISNDGSAVGGIGNGFNGIKVVVRESMH